MRKGHKLKMFIEGFGEVKVLDHNWWNIPNYGYRLGTDNNYLVGIVKIKDPFGEEKAYIGITLHTEDLEKSIKDIVMAGVPYYGINRKTETNL